MQVDTGRKSEIEVIKGEFCTDGKTFIFSLAGTPLSGTGNTASAAFEDLMRTEASAGALSQRLKELARDQQGEQVRATVIRSSLMALIVFGVIAGTLVVTAAMVPRVATDLTKVTLSRLDDWIERMPPSTEQRITGLLQRAGTLMRASEACPPPAGAVSGPPK
jgi:hypothetical protein